MAPWIGAAIAVVGLVLGFVAGRLARSPSGEGSIRTSTLSQGTRDSEPAVSPDGRLAAFGAVRQDGQGLWLMDMITRSEVKLTSESDHFPRFSADGGSILFTRLQNGRPLPVAHPRDRRHWRGSSWTTRRTAILTGW